MNSQALFDVGHGIVYFTVAPNFDHSVQYFQFKTTWATFFG